MGSKFASVAMIGAVICAAAPALAWSEQPYTQPASNEIAVWAYPSRQNYCPAGLQPVVVGGVICCGQPNAWGYENHRAPTRASAPRHRTNAKPYIAYGKGYNEGYAPGKTGYVEGN